MNKKMFPAICALLLGAAIPAAASDCPGFLPPNDMKIPVGSPAGKGIGQDQFNQVLDTIQKIYAPIVAQRGGKLVIKRLWDNATVNASAMQSGNSYILNMYGGLARHEAVTMDGFALVVCHELGHHLGGAPKKDSPYYGNAWASNEGQSDYYASLKCLRQVFADPAAKAFTRASDDTAEAALACKAAFKDPDEQGFCIRSAKAGKSVTKLFMTLHNETTEPRYDTPDPKIVTAMFDSHPATQCRLDTYLQGAICAQPVSAALSEDDPVPGTCTRSGGFKTGFRPLCWYKPESASELMAPGEKLPAFNPGYAFGTLRDGFAW